MSTPTPFPHAQPAAAEVGGGRYEVVRTLGRGAFGHTFLARDREGDRTVAIKLFETRGRPNPKAYELFRREADVLRAVRHHGIPEVYDTLQDVWYGAPATFLVMEYIEGTSLAHIIDEKRSLDGADVVHLFLELLGILDYLHGRVPPILHRDIKPSNIILRPNGFPALVDFGSVRRVFMTPEETGSTIAGTYGYMPYEQYMGQATPASDLFATAATMLHLLTGRAPREFMNDEGRIQVPDTLPAEPRLRAVVTRLLRPSPTERYASARDVRNALVGGNPGGPVSPVSPGDSAGSLALMPTSRSAAVRASPTIDAVMALPPTPREIEGETSVLMKRATPSTLRLLYASEKGYDDFGVVDVLSLVFFSVITAGILPIIFASIANTRRRRMRRFFRHGEAAVAEVTRVETEKLPFDEKIARVSYQFQADGQIHRDSDTILPTIAHRWQPGDQVPILYLADRDYDSVIVAVE